MCSLNNQQNQQKIKICTTERSLFSGNIYSKPTINMKIFIHFHKNINIFLKPNKVAQDFEKFNYIQPKFILLHTNHHEKFRKTITR